ncbi:GtrA family protein [Tepidamorphus sp. 3E244]|uniref:GtrA family protein n=1 Tax=Tepidamorphus sp. 3E244 TaxID=3385498 RepID=UPI0038FCFA5A
MIGVISALLDIAVMQILLLAGINYLVATTIAFALSVIVNFSLHSKYTFSLGIAYRHLWKYLILVVLNYLVTVLIVATFEHTLASPMIGKLISLPVIAVIGFTVSRFWVFRQR